MTKTEFCQKAHGQPIVLANLPLTAKPVMHATGSCGWREKCSLYVKVGDEYVRVLASVTFTVVKSKTWAK